MSIIDKFRSKMDSLINLKVKYLFYGSVVVAKGKVTIGKNVKIKKSKIIVNRGSSVALGNDCLIENVSIRVQGDVNIGNNNILEQKNSSIPLKIVGNGDLKVGNFNRIRSKMWIRYNGIIEIGNYSNINEGGELRCDELIKIGNFSRISYNVNIWDTNTHNIYPYEKRRKLITDNFPILGMEYERPKSAPIVIGNDCWISQDVAILKGTVIEDRCIVGFRALLTNVLIKSNTTVFTDTKLKEVKNNI